MKVFTILVLGDLKFLLIILRVSTVDLLLYIPNNKFGLKYISVLLGGFVFKYCNHSCPCTEARFDAARLGMAPTY